MNASIMLAALRNVKALPDNKLIAGICASLDEQLLILGVGCNDIDEYKMYDAFMSWPKFSGDVSYPVHVEGFKFTESVEQSIKREIALSCDLDDLEACIKFKKIVEARKMYHNSEDRWTGAYGDARRELLDFLIEYYTQEVADLA